MIPHVDRIASDWSSGVDHGGEWPAKLVACKYHCVEGAKRIVDLAMDISGGTGMFKRSELERLYRDFGADGDLRVAEYESMGGMAEVVQTEVAKLLASDPAGKLAADASPGVLAPGHIHVEGTVLEPS